MKTAKYSQGKASSTAITKVPAGHHAADERNVNRIDSMSPPAGSISINGKVMNKAADDQQFDRGKSPGRSANYWEFACFHHLLP